MSVLYNYFSLPDTTISGEREYFSEIKPQLDQIKILRGSIRAVCEVLVHPHDCIRKCM